MARKQGGGAFVPLLIGLVLGGIAGWLLVTPPWDLLVDDVTSREQLSPEQIANLRKVLAPPPPPPCTWPDMCGPPTARERLDEIQLWVTEAPIDPVLKQQLESHVTRCLSPQLTNAKGHHVCILVGPEPCNELQAKVWAEANTARTTTNDDVAWSKVKDEFELFPSGRPPQ